MMFNIFLRSVLGTGSSRRPDMHPNAPQARAAGLRPGTTKIKLLRWSSKFAGHLVAPEGGTLRWLDEFAGHNHMNHYDGLKLCPAITMILQHARP